DYAHRLRAAGTPATLDVVPGAPHGFEGWGAGTGAGRAFARRARTWLAAALGLDIAADRDEAHRGRTRIRRTGAGPGSGAPGPDLNQAPLSGVSTRRRFATAAAGGSTVLAR